MGDFYNVLGVQRTATQDEINVAFKKLAMKYHPDVNKAKGSEEIFKSISEANETLSNPQKRADYDLRSSPDYKPPIQQRSYSSSSSYRAYDYQNNSLYYEIGYWASQHKLLALGIIIAILIIAWQGITPARICTLLNLDQFYNWLMPK